jgi:hypothetical protein
MIKKYLVVFGLVLSLVFAIPALANILSSATATADCGGFSLIFNAADLSQGTQYTITYTFTLTCNGPAQLVTGSTMFTATAASQQVTANGTWPGAPLGTNCTVSLGSATLTSSGSTVPITINGSASASLNCGGVDERMTGGGSVLIDLNTAQNPNTEVAISGVADPTRVTHGYEIHCGNPPPKNNNIEVNWPGHHFHLETLTLGTCVCDPALLAPANPDAGFNEFIGAGTGKLDGVEGASIVFDFTDQGEPGTNDTEQITIFDPGGNIVLTFTTTNITFGNQQAHRVGGPKVTPCNPVH